MPRPLPRLLTAAEVAEVLRVKPNEVGLLCKSGELRATKPKLKWLIDADDLAAYLEKHSNQKDVA